MVQMNQVVWSGRAPTGLGSCLGWYFEESLPECNCNSFGSISDIELLNDPIDVVSGGVFS
jgi:hypothetical protein